MTHEEIRSKFIDQTIALNTSIHRSLSKLLDEVITSEDIRPKLEKMWDEAVTVIDDDTVDVDVDKITDPIMKEAFADLEFIKDTA